MGENKRDRLPRWRLELIYPSLDHKKYNQDLEQLKRQSQEILQLIRSLEENHQKQLDWIEFYIKLYNSSYDLYETLYAFAYMHYSVDTNNYLAVKRMNELSKIKITLKNALVSFRKMLASLDMSIADFITLKPALQAYSFFLKEQLLLYDKQMSLEQEELATDLIRFSGDLFGRLQKAVSSNLEVVWNKKTGEKKTVTQLRGLAYNSSRVIRKKAFSSEIQAWHSVRIPLTYAINGIKGISVILNKRRNYKNTLERSLIQARINDTVLNSLLEVMYAALPHFRRYLKTKARILGLEKLAFFDIFAPVSISPQEWSYKDACSFIQKQFASFSQELSLFAEKAFANYWLDAKPRKAKVGGGYCIGIPLKRESRILCNFDGSFSAVTTIAHELGHAYHHHILCYDSYIHRDYPMTLAETASIFCENIIMNRAIENFTIKEKIEALEIFLSDATQVIVDILSRYIFETELIRRCEQSELAPEELCFLMCEAQKKTYGDALDWNFLHPYMWAVKGHYYSTELAFYNFPYAFGLLFGLGLFALYKEKGTDFIEVYKKLLKDTGRYSCIELTKNLGFNIQATDFWERSINMIITRIAEFEKLAAI